MVLTMKEEAYQLLGDDDNDNNTDIKLVASMT